MLLVFFFPSSRVMYLFCYFTWTGVIAFAVYIFRNSFIFHHIDKLTDLVIHLFPLVIVWNIHWNLRNTEARKEWGFIDVEEFKLDLQFVIDCIVAFNYFYVLWAAFYFTFILGIRRRKIIENNYWTFIDMQVDKNKIATKLKAKYGMWLACIYFSLNHYVYWIVNGLVTIPGFFYESYALIQMAIYVMLSLKNGVDYYFDYFPTKYELNLQQLDELEKNLVSKENESKDTK